MFAFNGSIRGTATKSKASPTKMKANKNTPQNLEIYPSTSPWMFQWIAICSGVCRYNQTPTTKNSRAIPKMIISLFLTFTITTSYIKKSALFKSISHLKGLPVQSILFSTRQDRPNIKRNKTL